MHAALEETKAEMGFHAIPAAEEHKLQIQGVGAALKEPSTEMVS